MIFLYVSDHVWIPDVNGFCGSSDVLIQPFQCLGYLRPKHKDVKIFENHLSPVMLVLIGLLSLSTNMSGFQSFFIDSLHHFILAKLATSDIRVKTY